MNLFWKALGYVYAYIHLFCRLKGLNSQVHPSGSSADFVGETKVQVRHLVSCWLQPSRQSPEPSRDMQDGVFQCRSMRPPPFSVSLSRFTLLNPSAFVPVPRGMLGDYCHLPPSMLLPCRSASLPVLKFGSRQPILPIHWDNFLQTTLETKDKTAEAWFLFFPCQKPYVPCQDVTRNTLRYRHTSFMLIQSRETFTPSSHVISSLMHQGKASALQWGLSPRFF